MMRENMKKLVLLICCLFLCLTLFADETTPEPPNLDFIKNSLGAEVEVNGELFNKAADHLKKYGAQIELVDPSTDPRWNPGSSGRVVLEKDGSIRVLLPKGEKIRTESMMEKVLEAGDLHQKVGEYGKEYMDMVFEKAGKGDKQAKALLLDMEIKAKERVISNLKSGEAAHSATTKELNRLVENRDKMYDKTLDFKKLIEAEDCYSVGRKLEDYLREKGTLAKADKSLKEYIEETVKILKYGDPTPESEKIVLVRGVVNDKVWGEKNGRPYMLPNRINHGRTGWDTRLSGIDRYFAEATDRSWHEGSRANDATANPKKVYDLQSIIYDHAESSENSAKSVLISTSGTAKEAWGPPFYVIKVNPKRAIFNHKSPFIGEAEVLIPFFVLPNEIHKKCETFSEVINDPLVKESPYFKMANKIKSFSDLTEKWKKIEDNICNGRAPLESVAGLDSRYDTYNVGPDAPESMIEKFKSKLEKYGAELEYVEKGDARLSKDGQARTYMTEDGKIKVLLPKDMAVKKFALVDEFTHVIQLKNMSKRYGTGTVTEIFKAGAEGSYLAIDLMNSWEIKAKENVLLTMDKNDPSRKLVKESLENLKKKADPLYNCRKSNGRLDWKKVNSQLKNQALGLAHFALTLFLKELAVAVQTQDRFVIEEFFNGLLTTDFFVNYGLYTAGAMGTEFVYTKFLQQYIKPKFINNVLKSSLAVAVGMALPDLIQGHFSGKTFAINVSGLFLSSTAIKSGMGAIKWAVPLGQMASKAPWVAKIMTVYKASKWAKVGGWVYTAAEAAVVLYFGDKISQAITNYLDEKDAKDKVGEASEAFLEAIKSANKDKVGEATKKLEEAYNGYRNFLYKPLELEETKLMVRLNKMGRELKGLEDSYNSYMDLYKKDPTKYASLKRMAENLKEGKMKSLEKDMKDAFAIYERSKGALMKEIYLGNLRKSPLVNNDMETLDSVMGRTSSGAGGLLDRATNWWKTRSTKKAFYNPSSNRLESYVDEADVINLAMAMNSNKEIRDILRLRMDEIKLLADTDRVFFEATSGGSTGGATSSGTPGSLPATGSGADTEGMLKRLHGMGR